MRALVVEASGGFRSAFLSLLAADARFTQVTAWSRSAAVVTGNTIFLKSIDLRDEATIEAAAQSLGEVDLVSVATGLLHDGDLKTENSWRSIEPSTMIRAFEINTIGPALIAKHVLPLLPRDRRAVFAAMSARCSRRDAGDRAFTSEQERACPKSASGQPRPVSCRTGRQLYHWRAAEQHIPDRLIWTGRSWPSTGVALDLHPTFFLA